MTTRPGSDIRSAKAYIPELRTALKNRKNKPEISLTNFKRLNSKLWGLNRGELYVIAARTSQGKSAFALNLAWNLATISHKILYMSLEMTSTAILERLFIMESRIANNETRGERAFDTYEKEFNDFEAQLSKKHIGISEMIGKKWDEVYETIESLQRKPDVLFIDHLQEIEAGAREKRVVINEYLDRLIILGRREKIAIVLCSQINRASQSENSNGRPALHNISGSGAIEEKADVVLLLHWPYMANKNKDGIDKNKFDLEIAKNRSGGTGFIKLNYEPEFYTFTERPDDPPKATESGKGDGVYEEIIKGLNKSQGKRPVYAGRD
jgi:replicative DNA helicase